MLVNMAFCTAVYTYSIAVGAVHMEVCTIHTTDSLYCMEVTPYDDTILIVLCTVYIAVCTVRIVACTMHIYCLYILFYLCLYIDCSEEWKSLASCVREENGLSH